jgi:EmrB/QacA subfamily drug resistance transporter
MTSPHPTEAQKRWTLLAVCLGTFMLLLDVTIVIVALPDIRTSLDAGFSDVQWTVDAYSLSLAALLLPAGSLADLIGRRRVFAGGLAIFTVGSLLCGVSQSAVMLVVCRALQGIGGATVFATSLALLAQTFHGRERGAAFGAWGAVAAISTALGPVLGGLLTSGLSWRWIFLVNLPVGAAAIWMTLKYVAEFRPGHARRLDVAGFVTFTVALVALVFGLIEASERGWGDSVVVGAFVVAAVLLVAFPFVERAVASPMFDLALFRKPTFVGGSLAAFGMNGSLFAMFLYLILYFQDVKGYDALGSGSRLVVITGATLFTAIPAGRLSARVNVKWLIGPGLFVVGAGLLLTRAGLSADSSWTALIPGFVLAGLGSGLVNAPLASTAVGVVAPQDAGMASGINTTFRQVAIATSIAALGSIFATKMKGFAPGSSSYVSHYASTMDELLLITAIVAFAAGAFALVLIRARDFVHHAPPQTAEAALSAT